MGEEERCVRMIGWSNMVVMYDWNLEEREDWKRSWDWEPRFPVFLVRSLMASWKLWQSSSRKAPT